MLEVLRLLAGLPEASGGVAPESELAGAPPVRPTAGSPSSQSRRTGGKIQPTAPGHVASVCAFVFDSLGRTQSRQLGEISKRILRAVDSDTGPLRDTD